MIFTKKVKILIQAFEQHLQQTNYYGIIQSLLINVLIHLDFHYVYTYPEQELTTMSDTMTQALHNAAASSAMEGLPLEPKHMDVIQDILDGKTTLQEFFRQLQKREQEI